MVPMGQKKDQKPIAEPAGADPLGGKSVSGAFAAGTQFGEKLTSAAQMIAEPFIAAKQGNKNRKQNQFVLIKMPYIKKIVCDFITETKQKRNLMTRLGRLGCFQCDFSFVLYGFLLKTGRRCIGYAYVV